MGCFIQICIPQRVQRGVLRRVTYLSTYCCIFGHVWWRSGYAVPISMSTQSPVTEQSLEKGFQSGQNFHELLQSDILDGRDGRGLCRRAVPNWGRAYHGNATKHREKSDVEGTHVSAKGWYPTVRRYTYEMRGAYQDQKIQARKVSKLLDPLLGDKSGTR